MKNLYRYVICLVFIFSGIISVSAQAVTTALNQSTMSNTSLLVWANEAGVSAFSYNFTNYKQALQKASVYFTPTAWNLFKTALDKSKNLDTVIQKKLIVSAVADGSPVIVHEGVTKDAYNWKVQLPLVVSYQSASEIAKQHLLATMVITRVPTSVRSRGIAIEQFTTTPDKTQK